MEKYILSDSLGHLLRVAHWKLHQKLIGKFEKTGINITPDQWNVLVSLANEGDAYQSQLATWLHRDRAGIKRLVDHLVTKGLVTRKTSDTDTRTNIISLTEQGKGAVLVLNGLARETLVEAQAGFDEQNLLLLKQLLRDLIGHLT